MNRITRTIIPSTPSMETYVHARYFTTGRRTMNRNIVFKRNPELKVQKFFFRKITPEWMDKIVRAKTTVTRCAIPNCHTQLRQFHLIDQIFAKFQSKQFFFSAQEFTGRLQRSLLFADFCVLLLLLTILFLFLCSHRISNHTKCYSLIRDFNVT